MSHRSAIWSVVVLAVSITPVQAQQQQCQRTIVAKVAAIDQMITYNRLGSNTPAAEIFALLRDVQDNKGNRCDQVKCAPGQVSLRPDKRPRPIVLRANVHDCLEVQFTNLIYPNTGPATCNNSRPDGSATCYTGMHIQGLELRNVTTTAGDPITNDASWAGANKNSLVEPFVPPGNTITYHYYVPEEGTFFLYAMDDSGVGQFQAGLFGSINVEPPGAEYYRSQVTQTDLQAATAHHDTYKGQFKDLTLTPRRTLSAEHQKIQGRTVTLTQVEPGAQVGRNVDAIEASDGSLHTPDGHPIINYDAVSPDGTPILNMLKPVPDGTTGKFELVYTDSTAIITGPYHGTFTSQSPSFNSIYASPDRRQPYREFSIHYHQPATVNIAFPNFITGTLNYTANNTGGDNFGINYGIAGIAPEVFANRLGVGPVKDCVECKFEEFFLSSWPLGDPAMVVDNPTCPGQSCSTNPATKVFFPDDPSNVYHSYLRDHVKFRIHNAANQAHLHHQHAHQWLRTPNSDNSLYLDSQLIVPGSSYTLEMDYGGSGNRNFTAGDSIFHCHFYPHFAQGMWALWRVHDTFESGTVLQDGKPKLGSRALPDGEIVSGTPVPAIVPLPTLGMAPLPAKVQLVENGRRVEVSGDGNPGYPFFVPGLAGHRAPHPPMGFAVEETSPGLPKLDREENKIPLDGGLPRHLIVDGRAVTNSFTRWDFSKDFIAYDNGKPVAGWLQAFQLPENGTKAEIAAMDQHSGPPIQTSQPNGAPGLFYENGLPPVPGGPFANPDVGLTPGNQRNIPLRRYQAAVIQTDAVLNKVGWHYPQERFVTLWSDVQPTLTGNRPPQPFFFRANSGQSIEFWHTNLVPDYYQVDDFQVRTPTDIIGEHIHLVKFDVLSSDGAANGFNYETGTLSPDDVRNRIDAINLKGGLYPFDPKTQWINPSGPQKHLQAKAPPPQVGPAPPGQNWNGAQTTVERWSTDPLENHDGFDRTLRSVFTHDHFGPSTHQQAGLYAALLVEPRCSQWLESTTGVRMGTQPDGGPTSWQANILQYNDCRGEEPTGPITDAYREFALEFQDLSLAYTNQSIAKPSNEAFQTTVLFVTSGTYGQFTNNQTVPPALATELCNNGISLFTNPTIYSCNDKSLTTKATLHNAPPQNMVAPPNLSAAWYIWDPIPANTGTATASYHVYALLPSSSSVQSTQQVLTPYIEPGWVDAQHAINPPQVGNVPPDEPQPTLVSSPSGGTPGVYSVNYRNEPLPLRVTPPAQGQAQPNSTDLSYAYSSTVTRNNGILNCQPVPFSSITDPATSPSCQSPPGKGFTFPAELTPGMLPNDPYTPLLRAYENDNVQVRVLTGAHVQPHGLTIHGVNWLFEPTDDTSGYHAAQGMGISEHFEMLFQLPKSSTKTAQPFADYLYAPSSGVTGQTSGVWGIMRAYAGKTEKLQPLPNNPTGGSPGPAIVCPSDAPVTAWTVVATTAAQVIEGGALVYNPRNTNGITPVTDPNALIFMREKDVPKSGEPPIPANQVEPLVLRANAGDCIQITLKNQFNADKPFQQTSNANPPFGANLPNGLPNVTLNTSSNVGLHAGVVSLDVSYRDGVNVGGDGVNVGMNPTQTVAPGGQQTWYWYAGNRTTDTATGKVTYTPMEFGAIGLTSSDPLLQPTKGLVGALVIEPKDAKVTEDPSTPPNHASATVTYTDPQGQSREFREFVVVMQDSVEAGGGAINYRSETANSRFPSTPGNNLFLAQAKALANAARLQMVVPRITAVPTTDPAELFSNQLVGGDPQTPVFTAKVGKSVRFRVVYPGGDSAQVLNVHGHVWQDEPYVLADGSYETCPSIVCSQRIGNNGRRSEWIGARQMDPNENADFVIDHAGGAQGVTGDYLFNTILQSGGQGTWGLLRVEPLVTGSNDAGIKETAFDGQRLTIRGAAAAKGISVAAVTGDGQVTPLGSTTVAADGSWSFWVENSRIPRGATIHVAPAQPEAPITIQAGN